MAAVFRKAAAWCSETVQEHCCYALYMPDGSSAGASPTWLLHDASDQIALHAWVWCKARELLLHADPKIASNLHWHAEALLGYTGA